MARTDRADEIRDAFLNALRAQGTQVRALDEVAAEAEGPGLQQLFRSLGRSGREIYLVGGVGLINIHIRSTAPGWWNIVKTVHAEFDQLARLIGRKTFYVLLVGRKTPNDPHVANGWIASDFTSPPFIQQPSEEATKFTVKAEHLDDHRYILGVTKLAQKLIEEGEADPA